MKDIIRILAVDGGGIGGVIPLSLLTALTKASPALIDRADLVAGTSTGGLIALGLAAGKTPAELLALYREYGPRIFSWGNRRTWAERAAWAKFSPAGLRAAVEAIAGDRKVGELTAKPVFVPVTAVRRPPHQHYPAGVFVSTAYRLLADAQREQLDAERGRLVGEGKAAAAQARMYEREVSGLWRTVDLALATAAAPTYFPPHPVPHPDGGQGWVCWDGGLTANNPALAALGEVYRLAGLVDRVGQARPDVRVLSLGTGFRNIDVSTGDLSPPRAARPVIQTLMDASVGSTAFVLRQLLGDRAARANVVLQADYEMDDPAAMLRLVAEAEAYSTQDRWRQPDGTDEHLPEWLNRFWLD